MKRIQRRRRLFWVRLLCVLFSLCMMIYIYMHSFAILQTSTSLSARVSMSETTKTSTPVTTVTKPNSWFARENQQLAPLLTLFTTWTSNDSYPKMRSITLRNWAHFKPHIRPIFFSCGGANIERILQYGLDVLPVTRTAASGIPVLQQMFMDVTSKYKSTFYGYCNGDILFNDGLINTLLGMANSDVDKSKPILFVGRRTNVLNVTENESRDVANLARVARDRGDRFTPDAIDYFITDSSFPWADIPDLVIGRSRYDNWLVLNSRQQNHSVIDSTHTVLAVHQTTKAGNFEWNTHKETSYNVDLLQKLFNKKTKFPTGCTWCTSWLTHRVEEHDYKKVTLSRGRKLKSNCKLD